MNKTAILSFIIDEVVLKARNVSTNMRKRIHSMIKEKNITVKNYHERALILNGSIRVGNYGLKIEEMKKGVSNYIIETQEQLDKLAVLNNEIRFHSIDFNPTDSLKIESVEDLKIDQSNYETFSKCSFNTAKRVLLQNLSTDELKSILSKIKSIGKLEIYYSFLENIDFSPFGVKSFSFASLTFKGPVYLPREIEELDISKCRSLNLIKAQRVNAIRLEGRGVCPEECKELAKSLRGVKTARVEESLTACLTSLPSTLRKINIPGQWYQISNLQEITECFPYLIQLSGTARIDELDRTKLKIIEPQMVTTEKKFSLRPKRIIVNPDNTSGLNNHPELFEKVDSVIIESNKFNFDVLPSEIKLIEVSDKLDEESETLNRLEKERE